MSRIVECVESGVIHDILMHPQHPTTKSLVKGLFRNELPKSLEDRVTEVCEGATGALLRLIFAEDTAKSPIIAALIEKFHLPLNIIAGHLDHVRETAFGQLTISVPFQGGDSAILDAVMEELKQHNVAADLVGYFHD